MGIMFFTLIREPQNMRALCRIPVEHFSSSSVHDKVYIMIYKVLWGGEILWQENSLPPTRRLSVSPFSAARSSSPLSPSLSIPLFFFHQSTPKHKWCLTERVWKTTLYVPVLIFGRRLGFYFQKGKFHFGLNKKVEIYCHVNSSPPTW